MIKIKNKVGLELLGQLKTTKVITLKILAVDGKLKNQKENIRFSTFYQCEPDDEPSWFETVAKSQ